MQNAVREMRPRGTPDFPMSIFKQFVERVSVEYHWHPEIELVYIEEGNFTIIVNHKNYIAQAGDIFFINGGELHAMNQNIDNVKFYSAVFYPQLLDFDIKNPFQRNFIDPIKNGAACFPHKVTRNDECYMAIKGQMQRIFAGGEDELSKSQQLVALYELILILYKENMMCSGRINKSDTRNSEIIKNTIAHIEKNLSSKITLKQLSDLSSFTEKYFCTFFKKQTNLTPVEYINRVRLERACELLKMHDISVTETALETGFESLSYFIRRFKKQFGVSPAQYKKQFSQLQKKVDKS